MSTNRKYYVAIMCNELSYYELYAVLKVKDRTSWTKKSTAIKHAKEYNEKSDGTYIATVKTL